MPTILVMEANTQVRHPLIQALKRARLDVITADNGLDGLTLAKKHQPDLLLCNSDLPGLNGYNVLVALRETYALAHTPFILLSAWSDAEEIAYALSLGATELLGKPFTVERIVRTVQRYLAAGVQG